MFFNLLFEDVPLQCVRYLILLAQFGIAHSFLHGSVKILFPGQEVTIILTEHRVTYHHLVWNEMGTELYIWSGMEWGQYYTHFVWNER